MKALFREAVFRPAAAQLTRDHFFRVRTVQSGGAEQACRPRNDCESKYRADDCVAKPRSHFHGGNLGNRQVQ